MNEPEVRAALVGCDALSVGRVEAWIAAQEWRATPDGWTVTEQLQGWSFDLEAVAGGVRIISSPDSGTPAVWVVPAWPEVTPVAAGRGA